MELKKKKPGSILIPRVTFALKVEDNFVHLVRDTKPLVAFYYKNNCKLCEEVKKFFLEYICLDHLEALQKKQEFLACKEDRLFPIYIASDSTTPAHHTVVYRLPSKNGKQYHETILLDGTDQFINDRAWLRKLKTSLHLMPSENKWKPQSHQADCAHWYAESGKDEAALILQWALGSGKTDGLIYMLGKNRHLLSPKVKKIYYICPNTLIEMWHGSVNTASCSVSDPDIMKPLHHIIVGYTQFEKICAKHAGKTRQLIHKGATEGFFLEDAIVVIDECQRYRNASKQMRDVLFALQFSYQTIGLTGTLFINDAEDILGGMALMKGPRLPKKSIVTWKSLKALEDDLETWRVAILEKKDTKLIDQTFRNRGYFFDPQIHDVSNIERAYPEVKKFVHLVKMSLPQTFEYLRNQKKNIQMGDLTFMSSVRNAYSTLSKSLCNYCPAAGIFAPKYLALKNNIAAINGFPQVVHSRFLDKGVKSMFDDLKKTWSRIEIISGETPNSQRQKIITAYNTGKLDLLLLSNVGGVGLDLHNTIAMHLFECFDNLQSELQASHRVARYHSHQALVSNLNIRPSVQIHKYISTFPDLKQSHFSVKEIQATETIFNKHYGQDIDLALMDTKGKKPDQLIPLTWSKDPNQWYISDILKQLQDQASKPGTIEEHMTKQNNIKQAEIEPFFKTFVHCAAQLSHSSTPGSSTQSFLKFDTQIVDALESP